MSQTSTSIANMSIIPLNHAWTQLSHEASHRNTQQSQHNIPWYQQYSGQSWKWVILCNPWPS